MRLTLLINIEEKKNINVYEEKFYLLRMGQRQLLFDKF